MLKVKVSLNKSIANLTSNILNNTNFVWFKYTDIYNVGVKR